MYAATAAAAAGGGAAADINMSDWMFAHFAAICCHSLLRLEAAMWQQATTIFDAHVRS